MAAHIVDEPVSSDVETAAPALLDKVSAANPLVESVSVDSALVESASIESASAAGILADGAAAEGASGENPSAADPDELSRVGSVSSPAGVEESDIVEVVGESGRSWRRWLPRPLTGILILLVVLSLMLAAVLGWKLQARNDREAAGIAALAAARDYAVALTSIDSSRIDGDIATIVNGATGEFKDTYSQSAEQLKPLLVQAKSVSKGHVVAASVQSVSDNQAVIMLFVDLEITNVTNPTPRIDRNRVVMTMDRVDGHWLTSKVELP